MNTALRVIKGSRPGTNAVEIGAHVSFQSVCTSNSSTPPLSSPVSINRQCLHNAVYKLDIFVEIIKGTSFTSRLIP